MAHLGYDLRVSATLYFLALATELSLFFSAGYLLTGYIHLLREHSSCVIISRGDYSALTSLHL